MVEARSNLSANLEACYLKLLTLLESARFSNGHLLECDVWSCEKLFAELFSCVFPKVVRPVFPFLKGPREAEEAPIRVSRILGS
jgi:hypothetical protein